MLSIMILDCKQSCNCKKVTFLCSCQHHVSRQKKTLSFELPLVNGTLNWHFVVAFSLEKLDGGAGYLGPILFLLQLSRGADR